jgi:hypothetical protein
VKGRRSPTFLLGAAALLMAIGVFLAVRSRLPSLQRRASHYYFRTLGGVSYSSAGRHVALLRPEMFAPLVLQETNDDGKPSSCMTHSLNDMTLDVGAPLSEDDAERWMNRGVKGTLAVTGSGGELYFEVLLAAKPPTLFLLERGAVHPLRINTALADALLRGCDAFSPPGVPSSR